MRPHRPAGVLAALALALVTACSSSSSDERATGTTTTTTAPPVTLAPAVEPVGTVTHASLVVDGRERDYRLYVPRRVPDGPVPLFIGLHGGTGWADQFAANDHIEGLAESNGFLVVHPDGVKVAIGGGGVWNGGVCCGVAAREGVDDVGFVEAVIDHVAADHEVDPRRVFAFGHSNGGIMSYRLACELADRVVGIARWPGPSASTGVSPTGRCPSSTCTGPPTRACRWPAGRAPGRSPAWTSPRRGTASQRWPTPTAARRRTR